VRVWARVFDCGGLQFVGKADVIRLELLLVGRVAVGCEHKIVC